MLSQEGKTLSISLVSKKDIATQSEMSIYRLDVMIAMHYSGTFTFIKQSQTVYMEMGLLKRLHLRQMLSKSLGKIFHTGAILEKMTFVNN